LLDVFVAYTGQDLDIVEGGQRVNYDPTGGFRRARSAAITLRICVDHWDGSLPAPADVVSAARAMVAAYGHSEAGRWDDFSISDDVDDALLWPDAAHAAEGEAPESEAQTCTHGLGSPSCPEGKSKCGAL
jgi:hypothetical protein